MSSFVISCESTVDTPWEYMNSRNIPVLFYSYSVDGVEYIDDMGRDPDALPAFYDRLSSGSIPTTSQLNEYKYLDFFDELLKTGDVLHIAFGTGMTNSVSNAYLAAETLRKKYPERKLIVIDSLCSSSGYGLLVDYAADMRDAGKSIDDIADWVMANRKRMHHQFYCTDLKYFRRSGRVSGAAATIGTVLNICPIMRLDDRGRIIAYGKVRGKKNALHETINTMMAHVENGAQYSGKCWICHSNCPAEAELLKNAVAESFPNITGDIRICDIGTIIASHCGPGTVAVFFLGDERLPE